MDIKNIVFDLYGTLVDIHTDEEDLKNWREIAVVFQEFGAGYTHRELKAAYREAVAAQQEIREEIELGKVFGDLLLKKGVSPAEDVVLEIARRFRSITTEYIRLYPGTGEVLEQLKKQGKHLYLLTNAQRVFTETELKMLGIGNFFEGIFISSDYGVKKPNPAFFRILLERCGISAEESLMIGNDKVCDIKGARSVGMRALYLHTNLSPAGDENMALDGCVTECESIGDVLR